MNICVVTLFPEMFTAVSESGITGRAIKEELVNLSFSNPRDFTEDKHRTVDDKPYGGGPGMLMKVAPLKAAIHSAKAEVGETAKVIYLSPQGKTLTQAQLQDLARQSKLVLIAGRYEGIDERVIQQEVDAEYSIGDYVLSGGELPAMVLIDGITRLQPGAVGDEASVQQDSFSEGLLDHPHYTRPEVVDEIEVPAVLLGGNHAEIRRWRLKQALGRTWLRRPDLIEARDLSAEETTLLAEFQTEHAAKK